MKLNRKWLLIVALLMSVIVATTGTLAYLQDSDADINVMTLGSVTITQNEQERRSDGTLDSFTNDEPILPAVYQGSEQWADEGVVVNGKEYKVFHEDMKNVRDKIVTVTNTGKTDAYLRTIVAIEAPIDFNDNLVHVNVNEDDYTCSTQWFYAELDGVQYVIAAWTYNEKLLAGETSAPSLLQVFLDKLTTNEDVAKLGDKWEIRVLSQAVQADGFESWGAEAALDEAFGTVDNTNVVNWFANATIGTPGEDWPNNNPPAEIDVWDGTADISWFDASQKEFVLNTAEQLAGMSQLGDDLGGKTIKLGTNINLNNIEWTPINIFTPETPITFDGQGYTIFNLKLTNKADVGLFGGSTTTGTIKNVTIENATLNTGGRSAFVAANHYGDIINCHVKNSSIEDSYWAAGAIAGLYNAGNIKDCTVTNVTVKSNGGTGGIVGVINETAGTRTVENCHVYNSTIHNTGAYGAAYSGGGIVGMVNISNSTVNITGCTVDAELKGDHIFEICAPVDEDITLNIN